MIQIVNSAMQIPDNERIIGVQGDILAQKRVFTIKKNVNGLDLSDYTPLMQLQAIYPTHPPYFDILTESTDGDNLILTWNIAAHDMSCKGNLYFQIQFSKIVGNETIIYQTLKDVFIIAPTIEVRAEYENMSPNVFEQYIKRAKDEADRAESIANGLIVRVDTATANANKQADFAKGVGDDLNRRLAAGEFKGDKGDSLSVAGSKNSLAELNAAFPNGDGSNTYLIGPNIYVWNGTAWIDGGRMQGESAYDEAVSGGYTGTKAQFIADLQGVSNKVTIETFDAHKADSVVHISTLTHSLTSTIHTLTGNIPTSGYATVRFKATADYKAGDTFKIGAVVYTAKPTGEEVVLPDKAFTTGDIVSCEVDIVGKRINFKLGSTGLPDGWNEKATGEAIEPIAKSAPIVQQIYGSWDTQINSLPPPDVLPSGKGNSVTYDNTGTYMAVAHTTSPYLTIYKRNGDNFVKLEGPTVLPTGTGTCVAFSANGVYLAVTHVASPYITIYKRTGDSFTKIADPSLLPNGNGNSVAFSPDGKYMAMGNSSDSFTKRYITIYKQSGDTFTRLSTTLASVETTNGIMVKFSSNSKYLVAIYSSHYAVHIYRISADDSFTLVNEGSEINFAGQATGVAFSPDVNYISITHNSSPYITNYKFINEIFTKLSSPNVLPNSAPGSVTFSSDGIYLMAVGDFGINIYKRSGDVFTKIANPSPQPNGRVLGVDCSNSGTYMTVAHYGPPYITTYRTQTKSIIRNATHWSNSPLSCLLQIQSGYSCHLHS